MSLVELLVDLKIPDVTALTAAGTLRRRMGYSQTLHELKRSERYMLTLDVADDAAALALAREIAEQTNLFVNPNKHAFRLRIPGSQANPRPADGLWVVETLITDADGAQAPAALAALRGRLGYGERVAGVSRGILWTLALRCEHQGQARRFAEEIVVTRARMRGLLCNPHFQEWNIL